MSLPSEFVFVPRPSSSCSIFWRRDRFEDEDEGRGRPREHLAEERFMESLHFFLKRIWTMNRKWAVVSASASWSAAVL